MNLFRHEAVVGRRRGLFGEVTVHQPVRLRAITVGFAVFAAVIVAIAATATIRHKESAKGWVVPEEGTGEVYAPQGALIQSLSVALGDSVHEGQVLGVVSTETYGHAGATGLAERREVAAQIAEIDAQAIAVRAQSRLDLAKDKQQVSSVLSTLASLRRQRDLQRSQLVLARRQYENAMPLVAKGFISQFDQDRRQQAVLSAEQGVGAIDQQIEAQNALLVNLRTAEKAVVTQSAIEQSRLRASRAGLRSSDMAIDARSGATLRAPLAGIVAAVNAKAGETVRPGLPLVTIAPSGKFMIELLLPTRSAGFVTVGQPVRIIVDAFPFQRFGALTGKVAQVNRAAILPGQYTAPVAIDSPSYRILVSLDKETGKKETPALPLRSGMTVTASIVTGRRSVVSWMLEPLSSPTFAEQGEK